MSRLAATFAGLRRVGRGGLVTYLTAGDPDGDRSAELLVAVAKAGADVIEVGVPFSDPVADGPVIQKATERALAAGMSLRGTLDLVTRVRSQVDTPIVLFTYANPVVRMGAAQFASAAQQAGVDGVLILDYPVEEAAALRLALGESALDPIFLISPTTTDQRIGASAAAGQGFLYVISRLGVTGVRESLPAEVGGLMARVRAQSDLPVVLGFGISRPEHVAEACRIADAAVVGSALVNLVAEHGATPDGCARAGEYVQWLKSAL